MSGLSESNSFCGRKDIHGFTEGFATVAQAIFLEIRGFGVGFADFRKEKYGVVTEAVCAALGDNDRAFGGVGNHCERPALLGNHNYADEMGAARISCHIFHFTEKLGDAIGIGGAGAGIACRMNSGRTAKCRYYES